MTRGRCGSLALHRTTLSFATPRRFNPAHKEGPMLRPARFDRIASGVAAAVTLVMGPTSGAWGQGAAPVGPASPPPAASSSAATANLGAALTVVGLAAIAAVIGVVAWYVSTRRKRLEEAAI